MQDQVNGRAFKDGLENLGGPFGGEEDYGAAGKPDGVSGGYIVDLKAV